MTEIINNYMARASEFGSESWWNQYIQRKTKELNHGAERPYSIEGTEIIQRNLYLLKYFEADALNAKEYSKSEIQWQLVNADFYLNHYLALNDKDAESGLDEETLDTFMEDYFPSHASWCSEEAIAYMCFSLEQFYAWMRDHSLITEDDDADLEDFITDHQDEWVDDYTEYENTESYDQEESR